MKDVKPVMSIVSSSIILSFLPIFLSLFSSCGEDRNTLDSETADNKFLRAEYYAQYDDKLKLPVKRKKENEYLIKENILIYRFNASILFFNSSFFRENLFRIIDERKGIRRVIIDASPVNYLDISGCNELTDIIIELKEKNIEVYFVDAIEDFENKLRSRLLKFDLDTEVFLNCEKAVDLSPLPMNPLR